MALVSTMVLCVSCKDSLLCVSVLTMHMVPYIASLDKSGGKQCHKARETAALRGVVEHWLRPCALAS